MATQWKITELVAQVRENATSLGRDISALAKAEIKEQVSRATRGAVFLALALVFALLALFILPFVVAYILVWAGLQTWAAFLIVFGGLLVLAALTGLIARAILSRISAPNRTIQAVKDSVAAFNGQLPSQVGGREAAK